MSQEQEDADALLNDLLFGGITPDRVRDLVKNDTIAVDAERSIKLMVSVYIERVRALTGCGRAGFAHVSLVLLSGACQTMRGLLPDQALAHCMAGFVTGLANKVVEKEADEKEDSWSWN